MPLPTLPPPPIETPLARQDGVASPTWTRWLQQLWDAVRGEAVRDVAVLANKTAAQSIPHATFTDLTWDVEDVDTHDAFTPASGVFVAPHAGRYLVSGCLHLSVATLTGFSELSTLVNGSLKSVLDFRSKDNTQNWGLSVGGSGVLDLAANDQVKLRLYMEFSGSTTRQTLADGHYCRLDIQRLGGVQST